MKVLLLRRRIQLYFEVLPLHLLLTVPFALQILGAIGLIQWLSWQNLAQINTFVLCLAALVVSIYLGSAIARQIADPILQLSQAACAIANGDLNQEIKVQGIKEIKILADSFNLMTQQLKAGFEAMEKTNKELEKHVEERTAELKLSEEKFFKAFWSSPSGMAISTLEEGRFIEVNESISHILGYAKEELIGKSSIELNIWVNSRSRIQFIQILRQKAAVHNFETQFRHRAGTTKAIEISAQIIRLDGQPRLLCVCSDITQRKISEAQLQASLHEKEILLKEIHHRVKNNLHIMANLLDLQSDAIQDPKLLEIFILCQNRIHTMTLIHEQLYQSENLAKVDLGKYIHRLVGNLYSSYNSNANRIILKIEVESVPLNIETAIPCGLLLNELVTNAFKHAFPHNRCGKVHIALHQDATAQLHLTIWDNGIGIQADFDWQNSPSLGLKLVHILSKQLKAKVKFNGTNGTFFRFSFFELLYKPRF